jgi:hypothetical protein
LKSRLTGYAKDLTESDPAFRRAETLHEFAELLKDRFKHLGASQTVSLKDLLDAKQNHNEKVEQYALRLARIYAQAMETGSAEEVNEGRKTGFENLLRTTFLLGLKNPALRKAAYDRVRREESDSRRTVSLSQSVSMAVEEAAILDKLACNDKAEGGFDFSAIQMELQKINQNLTSKKTQL